MKTTRVVVGFVLPSVLAAMNMWQLSSFTVDDAYISFRYAENLANGFGLVYNIGERVEGYSNFLWTVLLAAGIRCGADPATLAKILGALFAVGCLAYTYRLAAMLAPFRRLPCVATWLLASSISFVGYAVYGLETSMFAFLVLAAIDRLAYEERKERPVLLSALILALAALTRPEGPLVAAVLLALMPRQPLARRSLLRALLFVLPLAVHLCWRVSYYGQWLPATFAAKTGDFAGQLVAGNAYVAKYILHTGPIVFLACYSGALVLLRRDRLATALTLLVVSWVLYVLAVGGDWMPKYRFMAVVEPVVFLLVGWGAREIAATRSPAALLALALFTAYVVPHRITQFVSGKRRFAKEEKFWSHATGTTAEWLVQHRRGTVALGDIGYVGYRTGYPILDLLGLVDPVIGKLSGGYTRKIGPGFLGRFFAAEPQYALIISAGVTCSEPTTIGSQVLLGDARFGDAYQVAYRTRVTREVEWCIFTRRSRTISVDGKTTTF